MRLWTGTYPTPVPFSGCDRNVFVGSECSESAPSYTFLCVPQSWPFPKPVVQAHLSHGLLALTSLLLEIWEDFLEGWWCVVKTGSLI